MTEKPQLEHHEEEQAKLVVSCSQCHRPIRGSSRHKITGWLLRSRVCNCKPPDSTSRERKDGSKPARVYSGDFPSLDQQYEVLEFLGEGGMGRVFKVRDRMTGSFLAIKVLNSELVSNKSAVRWFEREVNALTELTHANLVQIYGHGTTAEGAPYLVMDYIEGETLAERLSREEKIDRETALDIFIQICEALAHTHRAGIVHRDIKPSNIMLSSTESGEVARLVDFGIAKLQSDIRSTRSLTETNDALGSPPYMSPEQCLGTRVTAQSDIYSLGCVLYEALTGNVLFSGANSAHIISQHLSSKPTMISRNDLPHNGLRQVIGCCVKKDNNKRLTSVDCLLSDLRLIKEGKAPSYSSLSIGREYAFSVSKLPKVIGIISVLVVVANFLLLAFPILPDVSYLGVSLITGTLGIYVILCFSLFGLFAKLMQSGPRLHFLFETSIFSTVLVAVLFLSYKFFANIQNNMIADAYVFDELTPFLLSLGVVIAFNLIFFRLARPKIQKEAQQPAREWSKLNAGATLCSLILFLGFANSLVAAGFWLATENLTTPLDRWRQELVLSRTHSSLTRDNVQLAIIYMDQGDASRAERYGSALIESETTRPADKVLTYAFRGVARLAQGETAAARADFRRFEEKYQKYGCNVLNADTLNKTRHLYPAVAALSDRDAEDVVNHLSYTSDDQLSILESVLKGLAYRLQGEDGRSEMLFRQCYARNPDSQLLKLMNGEMTAEELLEASDAKKPKERLTCYVLGGWKLMLDGQTDKAKTWLKMAVDEYPKTKTRALGAFDRYALAKSQLEYLERNLQPEVSEQ